MGDGGWRMGDGGPTAVLVNLRHGSTSQRGEPRLLLPPLLFFKPCMFECVSEHQTGKMSSTNETVVPSILRYLQ